MKTALFHESIGGEDECLENNNIYALISVNISSNDIHRNIWIYINGTQLFLETLTSEVDICIWRFCTLIYDVIGDIIEMLKDDIKKIVSFDNIKLEGVNLKINDTTLYELNNNKDNNQIEYIYNLRIFFIITIISLFIGTIMSFFYESDKEEYNEVYIQQIKEDEALGTEEESTFQKLFSINKNKKNKKIYNFLSAFNIIKNALLLNKKKEKLSNQNSLIELSTIRLIILFFILLGENSFIIIKFKYKGRHLLSYLKSFGFIAI